jgi:prevent-host-death family protein
MCPVDGNGALEYTMRELNQRTGQVMDEILKHQQPAYITKHGKFIAKIVPLDPGKVASAVHAAIARDIGERGERSSSADDAGALVYTMHELNQRTSLVVEEAQKHQRPAYLTRRGRFVAKVVPLEPGEIESAVLAAMAREIGQQAER